jgi:ADP-ribosylglycohydrolase
MTTSICLLACSLLSWHLAGKTKAELVRAARTMSSITHASPGTMDAAAAVALAAGYASATRGLPLNPELFIDYIATGIADGNPGSKLPGFIRELLLLRHCSLEDAAARITDIGIKENKERIWRDAQPGVNCISVGAWQTTLWALWCFLTNADSYVSSIAAAIAAGGDVDTTAAIAGGICGARVGASGEIDCTMILHC